ncbi:GmrSD restriction endonuclease domain-containing protein [Salinicoccus roseus]|uniref:GmrSD restriction endonuclease domain-containing protein n=1 Tax=Salinicoccus roseus TaxID=45670 RepID=UPI000F4E203F|nr:DUF262 domain-containing protein [Salinicoccus roseus]RPE52883.1 uncharacterized protein DUF1524 [Salinicoccus roseus]GGA72599.1 hypothetical protein GCM10007176_15950 [Salinicoccus roseus]
MSNYNVNNSTVNALLGWIDEGIVAIPEIQRPFVWSATKVRDLLDSLYKDYPIGYIITWQNPDARLKDGTVSHGKKILIDGQQRVTALMAAISGHEVLDGKYKKKRIKIAFHPKKEKFEVQNSAILKDKRWIPDIAEIFKPTFSSFNFITEYCNNNPGMNPDELNRIIQRLINIRHSTLGIIDLNHTLDIKMVTEIFIRINSTGVSLSQADFVMSKISVNSQHDGPIIRKTIDYFSHLIEHPNIFENIRANDAEFSQTEAFRKIQWLKDYNSNIYQPSYSDVLRVAYTFKFLRGPLSNLVSLLSGRDFETREFKDEIIESSFTDLKDGVMQFVDETNFKRFLMIVKSAGMIDKKLVRSITVLNFAYALYLLLREQNYSSSDINHAVRKWIVSSTLTERYSSSIESRFSADIKRFAKENPRDVIQSVEKGELSDAFWENTFLENLETSTSNSPFFNLYVMAQIYDNDYAFLSKSIRVQQLIEERGDVHHVFPKNYLQKNGFDHYSIYNQIANYVYTEQTVNLALSNQPPAQYMETVKKQIENQEHVIGEISSEAELEDNLRMNCIPESIFEMDAGDFQEFLKERRPLMMEKIRNYYRTL